MISCCIEKLTHWGRVTHICVSKLTIIGSDNGFFSGQCQAIIWINDGILFIEPLGTNFSVILIKIHTLSFMKMHLKMLSRKWQPFCLGLNVSTQHRANFMTYPMSYPVNVSCWQQHVSLTWQQSAGTWWNGARPWCRGHGPLAATVEGSPVWPHAGTPPEGQHTKVKVKTRKKNQRNAKTVYRWLSARKT